jgi:Arc/MetJ-type ribon-helix-helix transcriptional regulator
VTISDRNVRIMVTLPRDVVAWIDEQAAARERSRSWVVASLVRKWKRGTERKEAKQALEARRAAKLILGKKAPRG